MNRKLPLPANRKSRISAENHLDLIKKCQLRKKRSNIFCYYL